MIYIYIYFQVFNDVLNITIANVACIIEPMNNSIRIWINLVALIVVILIVNNLLTVIVIVNIYKSRMRIGTRDVLTSARDLKSRLDEPTLPYGSFS